MKSAQKAVVVLTLGGLVIGAAVGAVKAVAGGAEAYKATQRVPVIEQAVAAQAQRLQTVEGRLEVMEFKIDYLVSDVEERTGRRFRVRGTRPR